MADMKISELTDGGDLSGGDVLPVVRAGSNAKAVVPAGGYAEANDVATALAAKADTATVNTALAAKADTATVNTALAAKADTATVNTALAAKANATDMTTALAAKANLSGAQQFSGAQRSSVTAVSSASASTALDFALNNDFTTTLTENTTLANPTNLVIGQKGRITITQAATAKTVAYGSYFKFAGGTIPAVSTGAGAIDILFYDVIAAGKIAATLVKAFA